MKLTHSYNIFHKENKINLPNLTMTGSYLSNPISILCTEKKREMSATASYQNNLLWVNHTQLR